MLFNSIEFAFFLPIVFIIYWAIGYARINDSLKLRIQNAFVVIASYVFYGWWDWRFLILIAFTSFCSWGSGLLIVESRESRAKSKFWMVANVVINIGILAVFKYYDFFVSEFGELFGVSTESLLLRVILPVGISFYTFQALSYSIDVYRGKIKPTKDIIAFFAFISFFPQLVAGPIERATNLLPQFLNRRTFSYEQGMDGMRQILWGLFKKIVVADNCAVYVNQVWETYDTQSGSTLLLAAILFTFQIYGDFSGYSDIAIGTAKLFGIRLMRNFNNPYFSRDIAEFWRRWHISLTSWFRDYVYIPMGGSRPTIVESQESRAERQETRVESGERRVERRKKLIIVRNTFVVFLICGLWHGANWTYLVWGLYNVLLFLPLILLGKSKRYKDAPLVWKQLPQMLLTFVLVTIGWIIFRAPSMAEAWGYVCAMCSASLFYQPATIQYPVWCAMAAIILMLSLEWHYRDAESVPLPKSIWAYYPLIIAIWWFAYRNTQEFIYFQF